MIKSAMEKNSKLQDQRGQRECPPRRLGYLADWPGPTIIRAELRGIPISPRNAIMVSVPLSHLHHGCQFTKEWVTRNIHYMLAHGWHFPFLDSKRKASEEVASPDSQQQASKKARTDSPEKEVCHFTLSAISSSYLANYSRLRRMGHRKNPHYALCPSQKR